MYHRTENIIHELLAPTTTPFYKASNRLIYKAIGALWYVPLCPQSPGKPFEQRLSQQRPHFL